MKPVAIEKIKEILNRNKGTIKVSLAACASCSLCAESCFLYMGNNHDPQYMPSYKMLSSVGALYRKKGNVDQSFFERTKHLIWKNCVLCMRCYCPFGIDLPRLIALARSIYRTQGICGVYPHALGAPEEDGLKPGETAEGAETNLVR
jgi:Fe-S oxidoreductase